MIRTVLLLALLAPLPLSAAETPSFDCATAVEPRERVVCADAGLARADRAMAAAYAEARRRLDPATAALLREDQKTFVGELDDGFNATMWFKGGVPDAAQATADLRRAVREREPQIAHLRAEIEARTAFLRAVRPGGGDAVGVFMNTEVIARIGPAVAGVHPVAYAAGSYGWPKYDCGFTAKLRPIAGDLVSETAENSLLGTRRARMVWHRDGDTLHLDESRDETATGEEAGSTCPHRPQLQDVLFRVDPAQLAASTLHRLDPGTDRLR